MQFFHFASIVAIRAIQSLR